MIHFVGAGCGAPDLITVRGMRLLEEADVIIYAGSLVNPELLSYAKKDCKIYNSATMTLEEVLAVMFAANECGEDVVRLHTGEPSLYSSVQEQMQALDEKGILYDSTPGVSACFGAAAAMNLEYTLPAVSQSLIITRREGRTKMPEKESIASFAEHGCSMVIYLSASMTEKVQEELLAGGYAADTPAAIAYKVSWPDEKIYSCTVGTLAETAKKHDITKTAMLLVGDVLAKSHFEKSRLYAADFSTEYRKAKK